MNMGGLELSGVCHHLIIQVNYEYDSKMELCASIQWRAETFKRPFLGK